MSEAAIYAEMAVLGGVMDGADFPDLRAEHFYDPVHAALWDELKRRESAGAPIHPIALKGWWAEDAGRRELDAETPYLAELARQAPTHESVSVYAADVKRHAARRALDAIAADMKARAEAENTEPSEAIEAAESALASLAETGAARRTLMGAGMAFRAGLRQAGRGVSTGWSDLDHRFLGWKPGRYYVIAGRPGMGKTLFGAAVALEQAKRGTPVLFCSLEMSAEDLGVRLGAALSGVPYSTIERGDMTRAEHDQVSAILDQIDALPFTIAGVPGASPAAIRNMTRRHDRECQKRLNKRLGMVVVDYLGLLGGVGRGRYEDVTENSIALKQTSLELGLPVVTLAQLSRKVEDRTNKRPIMSDLRDSGGIEQDADAIMLLYREAYYANQEDPPTDSADLFEWERRCASRRLDIDIAKQRGGPSGRVGLYCNPATGEITDMDRRDVA